MAKHKRHYDEGGDVEADMHEAEPAENFTPKAAAKPAIVTKEQLAASGYDNLRDYLNAQKGLKRRDGSEPSKPAPKSEPKSEPVAVTKEKTTVTKAPEKEGGIGPYHMFSKTRTTEEGLAKMRAKDEAQRASFASPMENLASVAKKLREKAGITTYKKGGMASPSKRADGIARRGLTKCACGGGKM